MNRIIITERDETTNELTSISSDIVYVPGFAVGGSREVRNPKLCTSISEFENAFGANAPTFFVDQVYPLKPNSGNGAGFTSLAIPDVSGEDRIWYNAGTKDPSYVYAKELLRAGLSVVYERINMFVDKPAIGTNTNFKGLYYSTSTYGVGDFVVHENKYYKCITAIETAQAWTAENWTEVDANGNVLAFSTESTYEVGDYVTNNGSYYVCKVAVTTAGQWNSENWEEVSDIPGRFDVTVDRMYDAMMGNNLNPDEHAIYDENVPGALSEVSTYNVKYITSGGYPTFEYEETTGTSTSPTTLAQKMATLAASRGDAIAFIDHTDNAARPLTGSNSVYNAVSNTSFADTTASFATMITPWGVYNTTESTNIPMPGSFGYFLALARALRTYPTWLAIAGVVRGVIPSIKNLNLTHTLTNAIADYYQSGPGTTSTNPSINAITYINDQGYTVWGNRTLSTAADSFATHFLNMRSLICDVKKRAFKAAQQYMFEQNTDILWVNFKNDLQGLLDQMVSSSSIKYYKIIKVATSDKTKIAAKIQIVPIYAVETFEITIIMTDEEITVE